MAKSKRDDSSRKQAPVQNERWEGLNIERAEPKYDNIKQRIGQNVLQEE
jgi:hypothetical protein